MKPVMHYNHNPLDQSHTNEVNSLIRKIGENTISNENLSKDLIPVMENSLKQENNTHDQFKYVSKVQSSTPMVEQLE